MNLFNNTPECNCLPESNVARGNDTAAGPGVPAMCNYSTTPLEKHSVIRDWWSGYDRDGAAPHPLDAGSPQRHAILRSEARAAARLAAARRE